MIGCSGASGGPAMRRPKSRPGVEALEGRALLSGGVKSLHQSAPRVVRPAVAPVDLSGNWALQGRDPNGTDWLADLVVQQTANGKTLSGYFDWQANALAAYGREYVTGTFDPATRLVRLVGTGLQNASGIRASTYTAVL